jgi:hypothetical protein
MCEQRVAGEGQEKLLTEKSSAPTKPMMTYTVLWILRAAAQRTLMLPTGTATNCLLHQGHAHQKMPIMTMTKKTIMAMPR